MQKSSEVNMQQRNFALRRGPRPFHHPAAQDGPPSPLSRGRTVSIEQTRHRFFGGGAVDGFADQAAIDSTRMFFDVVDRLGGLDRVA